MKFSLFKHHSYHAEEFRSEDQLASDFGEFPPFPLECKKIESKIKIVRVSGIGSLYHYFDISRKLVRIRGTGTGMQLSYNVEVADGETYFHQLITRINKSTTGWSPLRKRLVLPIIRYAFVVLHGRSLALMTRRKTGGQAFFFPTDTADGVVTVLNRVSYDDPKLLALVSHEHIHLLQHKDAEQHRKNIGLENGVLKDEFKHDAALLYLLEKREIEARLHEIVLSYYNTTKKLPLTIDGFWELIIGNSEFGPWLADILQAPELPRCMEIPSYQTRGAFFGEQFADALYGFQAPDPLHRFISEVLTVMYGNLIRYYGDEASSLRFMSFISRPNLYDTLYGIQSNLSELPREPG